MQQCPNILVGRKAFFMENSITIIQISHKPINLRIPGFNPELSLQYYYMVTKNCILLKTSLIN